MKYFLKKRRYGPIQKVVSLCHQNLLYPFIPRYQHNLVITHSEAENVAKFGSHLHDKQIKLKCI